MDNYEGMIPLSIIDKWNRKYLAQDDAGLRSTLTAEMLYTLFLYLNGRINLELLEFSFNLTDEEKRIVDGISDIERMLDFYYDQDIRYNSLKENVYNQKFNKG